MNYKRIKSKRSFLNKDSKLNIILGSLLILMSSTVFAVGPSKIMSKQMLKFLDKRHPLVDYLLILCFIYVVIDFTFNDTKHPLFELTLSIIILILFICYSSLSPNIQIIILVILIFIYFINDNINYQLDNKTASSSEKIKIYTLFKHMLLVIIIVLSFLNTFNVI